MTTKSGIQQTFGSVGVVRQHSRIRAGIVGAGFIGQVHARAIRSCGAVLAAVSDGTPDRSAQAAHRLGAEAPVTTTEMLESPEIDVIHICTPNHLHAELARRAIAAGKHVVCEKPLATARADAEELVDRAARAGVVAAVPFAYRYYPTVREARVRVTAGASGPVRLIHGSYLQDWLSRPEDTNWRVASSLGGPSRTFADIGVHWCDLVEYVTGQRITSVAADLLTAIPNRGLNGASGQAVATEDAATVLFRTDQGALGSLVVSQVTPGRKNRLWFSVDGAETSLVFDQENPETLWVGSRDQIGLVVRGAESMSDYARTFSILPAGHPQGYQDCFDAFVGDVYSAIAGHPSEGMPRFEDGLRAAVLTEAVLQSAHSRSWVEVPR